MSNQLTTFGTHAWMCECENFHLMEVGKCRTCGQTAPPLHDQDERTLRDDFAMAALAGMMSIANHKIPPNGIAECAYMAADAMLAERERKKEDGT